MPSILLHSSVIGINDCVTCNPGSCITNCSVPTSKSQTSNIGDRCWGSEVCGVEKKSPAISAAAFDEEQ